MKTGTKVALGLGMTAGVALLLWKTVGAAGKKLEPHVGTNIVKWTGGVILVGQAIAPIRSKVSIFYILNFATNQWMPISGNLWDSYAINKDYICGIVVTESCALPSGFVWVG